MALLSLTGVKVISDFELILHSLSYSFNLIRKCVSFVSSYFQTMRKNNKKMVEKFSHKTKIEKLNKEIQNNLFSLNIKYDKINL